MHSLVMSPYSCDLIVMSLVVKLIGTWFLDSDLSTCLAKFLVFMMQADKQMTMP